MSDPALTRSDIANPSLASLGAQRIDWAAREMPVIGQIRQRFAAERPLDGMRIAACLHVTTETANLMLTLRDGGAELALCASNPLSTQNDVAAALVEREGISVHAVNGEDNDTYYRHLQDVLEFGPQITIDDGADLVAMLHRDRREMLDTVLGGTEETTTGVIRLRAMAKAGALKYPILAVNDADTKHLFDNRYGSGQSTLDGIIRATNVLLAGKTVVVAGYGMCGRGIAERSRGMGSHVIVTEVDPTRALEAVMDGYRVMPMRQAAAEGDIFITVTGDIHVIDTEALAEMRSGAILSNSGHFNHEINLTALETQTEGRRTVRAFVEELQLKDGRILFLLAEGRLVNLAAAEGHPASVMDMSFANHALGAEYLVRADPRPPPGVIAIPEEIDKEVARMKLAAMDVLIDTLTPEQDAYLHSWETGT